MVIKDSKILLFRYDSDRFDIYDVNTKSWLIGVLPPKSVFGPTVIALNNTVYVAGGHTSNGYFEPSDQVWKLEF